MNRSGAWEIALRRKLRHERGVKRSSKRWRALVGAVLFWGFAAACLTLGMVTAGREVAGVAGSGIALGGIAGCFGAWIGSQMRAALGRDLWIGVWCPAVRQDIRRIQMRGFLPAGACSVLTMVLVCWLGGSLAGGMPPGQMFAAMVPAAVVGFVISWGRFGPPVIWIGLVGCLVVFFFNEWFVADEDVAFPRLLAVMSHLWVPSMPWSWLHQPVPYAVGQMAFLGTFLVLSARDAVTVWRWWMLPLTLDECSPEEDESEEETPPPARETLRRDVRQSVHQMWTGMAGYLGGAPPRRFDRWVWRWLTPRERWLSCMGSQAAWTWFPATWWAVGCLAMLVALHRLVPQPWVDWAMESSPGLWLGLHFLLGGLALIKSWLGRDSAFQPLLEPIPADGLGPVPAFALLPVGGREWLRATAKEWACRTAWIGLWWGLAAIAILPKVLEFAEGRPLLGLWPIAALAAVFPVSVLLRLVKALDGEQQAHAGMTQLIPAILLGLGGVIGSVGMVALFADSRWAMGIAALAAVAACCVASLRLTLARVEGIRYDQRPFRQG